MGPVGLEMGLEGPVCQKVGVGGKNWNKNIGVGCHFLLQGMDLPDPGIEPGSPTLQADSLLSETPGKPLTKGTYTINQFSSVQSLSRVRLFATPWTTACQAPLSMGILLTRILEWVAVPSSRGSS